MKNHYDLLFADIVSKYGELDTDTITSIIGFAAGGPVSICTIERVKVCLTCELSEYPEQLLSSEELNFEFYSRNLDPEICRSLFTALGNLSMNSELGDGHTIDVTFFKLDGVKEVQLRLFSECLIDHKRFGVYEVIPI